MRMPTLENDGIPLAIAQYDDELDIPILDRIHDDDLTYNWMLEIRQQSPPPPPPSSPESRERSRSRNARAHSPRGRNQVSTRNHQIESRRSPVSKDRLGTMPVFTDLPPSCIDYSSMVHTYQQNPFSDDDAATKVDVSSPTRSLFSDSDTILGEPNKHSPYLTHTWDAVEQYKQQEPSQPRAWSFFPKPSPYDAKTRQECQLFRDPSRSPRRNISYPIMSASTITPPMLPDTSAGRTNLWPSSTTFEPSRTSPAPPSEEEKSGWFADEDEEYEKKGYKRRLRKSFSQFRRVISCGSQHDR